LGLFFSPVLNGAGGTVALSGQEASCGDSECTVPTGTSRSITGGSASAGTAASPLKWRLQGVTFADGATASGSFIFDSGTHSFSSVGITTTSGTRAGASYAPVSTGLTADSTGVLFVTSGALNQTGLPGFSMFFSPPLERLGGTSTLTGQEASCGDAGCSMPSGTTRLIASGSVVAVVPIDVSNRVRVTQNGFGRNRSNGLWAATLTVTNTSGSPINGPVHVALTNLSSNATMINNTGTLTGSPYITVSADALAAGASVRVTIAFLNPTNGYILYIPITYSGEI
jgi:hypothetical protein